MIIKLLTSSSDPTTTLRRRSMVSIGIFLLGLIGIFCSHVFLPESTLSDFAHGFYSGASYGLMLVGAIFFARCRYLLAHPDKAKSAMVKEKDEREQLIAQKAMTTGGLITFFIEFAALLIALPLSQTVFKTLLVLYFSEFLVILIVRAFYARKL